MDRQKVLDYINKKYKVQPEYPWRTSPNSAVMDIPGDKVGLNSADYVDVINLKIDDMIFRDMIIQEAGIMPAYHMNKMHWVSVLLDGTVPENKVLDLIDMSFLATASAKKKEKIRPPKEWRLEAGRRDQKRGYRLFVRSSAVLGCNVQVQSIGNRHTL